MNRQYGPFAEAIRLVRLKRLETQDEFGTRIGVTGRTVRGWETDAHTPDLRQWRKIKTTLTATEWKQLGKWMTKPE